MIPNSISNKRSASDRGKKKKQEEEKQTHAISDAFA
jgi:hypothetical protein